MNLLQDSNISYTVGKDYTTGQCIISTTLLETEYINAFDDDTSTMWVTGVRIEGGCI